MRNRAGTIGAVILIATLALTTIPSTPAFATAPPATIFAGYSTTCAVDTSGVGKCWGLNNRGQLGNGTTTDSSTPVTVSGGLTFAVISAHTEHTCGLTTSGAAYCWGRDDLGQLGDNGSTDTSVPTAVAGAHTFATISVGVYYACGVTTGGAGYCWGSNSGGQLGEGTGFDSSTPALVAGAHTWARIDAGAYTTCGVTTAGAGYCWGSSTAYGIIGDGASTDRISPTAISGGGLWTMIIPSGEHTCGLRTSGAAYCWGHNWTGQLGDGTTTDTKTPVAVIGGLLFASIAVSGDGYHNCALTSSHDAYCWGSNARGQFGDGTVTPQGTPTAVSGGLKWTSISVGFKQTCGVTTGVAAYCWGENVNGTSGTGDTTEYHVATQVWWVTGSGTLTVSAVVDPALTFTVAGRATVCNGQSATNFQSGTTATAASLGHLNPSTIGGASQDLSITTNAANGFFVYLRTSGTTPNSLRDASTHSIADVAGTRASPGAAPVAGTAGFGYTSSDASTAFTSNTWAKLTNTNDSVLIGGAGAISKSVCVGFEVAAGSTTTAGNYSASVIYTAVPTF